MDGHLDAGDQRSTWRTALARSIGPAGFVLALLLLALVPVAGVSCDPDTGGPVHLCYTGSQLLTGAPDVDLSHVWVGSAPQTAEFREAVVNTVAPPGVVRVLAAAAAVILAAGAASALLRSATTRAAAAGSTALAGVVLLVVVEVVTVTALADGAGDALTLFAGLDARNGRVPDGDAVAGTAPGFWLALTVLVALTAYGLASLARRRAAAFEAEMRTPGAGLPEPPR